MVPIMRRHRGYREVIASVIPHKKSFLIFLKKYVIIFIESEGEIMFDDFDTQIQCEEYFREWEFLEWCNAMEEMYG